MNFGVRGGGHVTSREGEDGYKKLVGQRARSGLTFSSLRANSLPHLQYLRPPPLPLLLRRPIQQIEKSTNNLWLYIKKADNQFRGLPLPLN